ncbi:hypothetical protein PGT21_003114 [Puccinia graminis f. sp. tritici]|uniref:Uncharacterized protein n=1 Tax=Puccinia graminis f. sp. tritici TaxID=56615 RepID=A0A5B0QEI1_PUCGR|nr:hypothetical protein PGT21_003114 [Puccinia graminis f. sp. tritici]
MNVILFEKLFAAYLSCQASSPTVVPLRFPTCSYRFEANSWQSSLTLFEKNSPVFEDWSTPSSSRKQFSVHQATAYDLRGSPSSSHSLLQTEMTNGLWQGLVLSSLFYFLTIYPSNARHHHHKPRGQQCRTAMSVLPSHFTYNNTAKPTTTPTNTTAPPEDPSKQHVVISLTGIPWQYEGKPIKSTSAGPVQQALTVTMPANQTTVPGALPSGDLKSTLCMDAGVLYSCTKCDRILYAKECYKKIGPEQLETVSSGEIACTKWYSRTGYAEGGGVTMCGAESGEVYQCSKDEDLVQCEPCVELGITSQA